MVFQNNETAAMWVYQDNRVGDEFFSFAKKKKKKKLNIDTHPRRKFTQDNYHHVKSLYLLPNIQFSSYICNVIYRFSISILLFLLSNDNYFPTDCVMVGSRVVAKWGKSFYGIDYYCKAYTPYSKMAANKLFFCLHVNLPSLPRHRV